MGHCGIPTLTCILVILFMGALYASASHGDGVDANAAISHERRQIAQRIVSNVNIRGRQGRVADSGGVEPRGRSHRRRNNEGQRRGTGRRRGPGRVGRRTLRRAQKVGNVTTPFATRLISELYPEMTHDTVFSPLSIHAVMTMTTLGARGRTEREISTALGLRRVRLRGVRGHRAYQALLTSLRHTHRDVHVLIANGIFVRPNIPLELNFRRQLNINYFANFDSFKMAHPDGPEKPINEWVANKTRDEITDLLSPGSITSRTAMVLINAMYVNATWEQPFNKLSTRVANFYSLSQGTKRLDAMEATHVYKYANHFNTEVVEIPFKGGRLSMYILLPRETSDINQLVDHLSGNAVLSDVSPLERMFQNMSLTLIEVRLPKFQIDSGLLDLSEALRDIGIRRAFQRRANFSGISQSPLKIDKVVHKSVIEVNEDGARAAAASAVYFGIRSAPMGARRIVNVNRPFLFVLRDKTMNSPLFIGTFLGQTRQEMARH